jgi:hypothetical protein
LYIGSGDSGCVCRTRILFVTAAAAAAAVDGVNIGSGDSGCVRLTSIAFATAAAAAAAEAGAVAGVAAAATAAATAAAAAGARRCGGLDGADVTELRGPDDGAGSFSPLQSTCNTHKNQC